ncbi:MAG TPA: hypothetical protein VGH19_22745 [Verrucomicrobiae bacterium]
MNKERPSISLPPFPELVWTGYVWEGEVTLPAWRRFIVLGGDFVLSVDSRSKQEAIPPGAEQLATFQHLLRDQTQLRETVLQAIFADYPRLRECYGDFPRPENMPEISNHEELLRLIKLNTVHIMSNQKDGLTRLGFQFSCKWDEEHGLGVSTHLGKVVAMGGADEAFSDYYPALDKY